ncbi:hypothetical protein P3T73_13630 [Kiritimatiellota bacterium B12222]|nr:hypothetical protein P3T73_13630 [Kiritimatiellota bacterium B12222]
MEASLGREKSLGAVVNRQWSVVSGQWSEGRGSHADGAMVGMAVMDFGREA